MEQNNFNGQGVSAPETREPAPTFDNQPQNGYAQQGAVNNVYEPIPTTNYAAQSPVWEQPTEPTADNKLEVAACVGSAFGKSLAATILAWFPICSIIAIVLGSTGLNLVARANGLAAMYGMSAGGKNVAAKILGMVGKIGGIVMTAIYALYFILIIAALA